MLDVPSSSSSSSSSSSGEKNERVLYGCETWTLTLRVEQRLRVFGNKVLRKIFGAKRDEVTEEWRKLHNAELHALYSSPDIIRNFKSRRLRWARHVARMGEYRNAYRVLVGRPERKRPLGRPRRRWEDIIKIDLSEVGYDDGDWINLAQDRDRWRAYVRFLNSNMRYKSGGAQCDVHSWKSIFLAYNTAGYLIIMPKLTLLVWNTDLSQGILKRNVCLRMCARFTRGGVVNFRNLYVWADENSHAREEIRHQHRF
ncbi:hypothetical protein ANN_09342 [Periplaneta americana]|uniref:Uncharacterized protein n=1 Tax=Periplaneta americana TaxID=6978 RepID=A0ABQ8TM15_PERAM|nr:hypothetical protein ANN_09342 [Periplaneta americana]